VTVRIADENRHEHKGSSALHLLETVITVSNERDIIHNVVTRI